MQFVPAYQAQYMHPTPMVFYPNEGMAYNPQFACDDILGAGQRDVESRGRRRITRQQASILENAFNENTKPNRNVRQELAQVLGISPRNVQIWFQNRRQKAKLMKKTVEQRTREVLEEATKRTEAEQAHKFQTQMPSPIPLQREHSHVPSTPRVIHRASSSTENTPTQPQLSSSPYPSPQEASYASLARSIAVAAAAAAAGANGPQSCPPTAGIPMLGHNPFFNSPMMSRSFSTFSDCTIDTPLTATPSYASTPFEYAGTGVESLCETPLPSNDPNNIGVAKQFPDFAAAVDAHNLKRPASLLHPRYAQLANSEPARVGGRPTLARINSCPADFVDAFDSVALASPVVEQRPLTLAAVAEQHTKRRRPRLSPLGVGMTRSKSSMGVCQSATAAFFSAEARRLSTSPTFDKLTKSTPSSPIENYSVSPAYRGQVKRESPQKFINTFLSVSGPPTPISPVGAQANQNASDISPTLSLARAAGLTKLKRPQLALNTEDIFSPPTTPAHSLNMQRGYSFSASTENVFLDSFDDQLSSSPSQFFIPEGMSSQYANTMDDVFASSYDLTYNMSDAEIDFSSYLEM